MKNLKQINGFIFDTKDNAIITKKPLRKLAENEVLVRNIMTGINPVDWKVKKENIIGVDGFGEVVDTNGKNLNPNQYYAYHCDLRYDGSFADYTIVRFDALIPVPKYIENAIAASIPCPGLTAMQSLKKIPDIQGKDVMICGGGMVSRILASLLIDKNARVCVTTHKSHHGDYYNIGAMQCFENYQDFNQKFDVIFDTAGMVQELLSMLKYNGHIIAILGRVEKNTTEIFGVCPSLHEVALAAIYKYGDNKDFQTLVSDGTFLFEEISQNKILLPKIETVNFSQIPTALKELQNGIRGIKFVAMI